MALTVPISYKFFSIWTLFYADISETINLIFGRSGRFWQIFKDRVATAQGKQGIWKSIFPDRENTGNLPKILKICFYTGNLTPTQGKFGGEKKNNELVI